jgi:predicted aspartyl protease
MGLVDVKMTVENPSRPRLRTATMFLVDSGALYSLLPFKIWKKLRLEPDDQLDFTMADGSTTSRRLSEARFRYAGRTRSSPVILGEEGDVALVGAVTLETLGLVLNPLRRELVPVRTMLACVQSSTIVAPSPPSVSSPGRNDRT